MEQSCEGERDFLVESEEEDHVRSGITLGTSKDLEMPNNQISVRRPSVQENEQMLAHRSETGESWNLSGEEEENSNDEDRNIQTRKYPKAKGNFCKRKSFDEKVQSLNLDVECKYLMDSEGYKIRRPPNAFILFSNRYRGMLCSSGVEKKSSAEVSKILGEKWRSLGIKEKSIFFEEALRLKKDHKKRYPEYVYNPNIATMLKKSGYYLKREEKVNTQLPTEGKRRRKYTKKSQTSNKQKLYPPCPDLLNRLVHQTISNCLEVEDLEEDCKPMSGKATYFSQEYELVDTKSNFQRGLAGRGDCHQGKSTGTEHSGFSQSSDLLGYAVQQSLSDSLQVEDSGHCKPMSAEASNWSLKYGHSNSSQNGCAGTIDRSQVEQIVMKHSYRNKLADAGEGCQNELIIKRGNWKNESAGIDAIREDNFARTESSGHDELVCVKGLCPDKFVATENICEDKFSTTESCCKYELVGAEGICQDGFVAITNICEDKFSTTEGSCKDKLVGVEDSCQDEFVGIESTREDKFSTTESCCKGELVSVEDSCQDEFVGIENTWEDKFSTTESCCKDELVGADDLCLDEFAAIEVNPQTDFTCRSNYPNKLIGMENIYQYPFNEPRGACHDEVVGKSNICQDALSSTSGSNQYGLFGAEDNRKEEFAVTECDSQDALVDITNWFRDELADRENIFQEKVTNTVNNFPIAETTQIMDCLNYFTPELSSPY